MREEGAHDGEREDVAEVGFAFSQELRRVKQSEGSASRQRHCGEDETMDAADGRRGSRASRNSISDGVQFMKRSVGGGSSGNRRSLPFGASFTDMGSSGRSITALDNASASGSFSGGASTEEIAEGPITDVQLLLRGHKCPAGFRKVRMVVGTGKPQAADLNRGQAGKGVHIIYKRGEKDRAPITALAIFHEGKEEFVPPGFEIVGTTVSGQFVADLSMGTGQCGRVFLCVCRGEGPPLEDICAILPAMRYALPEDYGVLERTPLGFSALLNPRHKLHACFLCARRSTAHLEQLAQAARVIKCGATRREAAATDETAAHGTASESTTAKPTSLLPSFTRPPSKSESFKTSLAHERMAEAPEGAIAALAPILAACYSYDVPTLITGLRYLERFLRSYNGGAASACVGECADLDIIDLVIKAAADSTELGVDVIFAPAMKVLAAALDQRPRGLYPLSVHFVAKAVLRTSCFFRMLPIKLYTASSQHRAGEAHRFAGAAGQGSAACAASGSFPPCDEESSTGDLSSASSSTLSVHATPARAGKSTQSTRSIAGMEVRDSVSTAAATSPRGRASVSSCGEHQKELPGAQLLASMSFVPLEDLNFLLRCPAQIFDLISVRVADSESTVAQCASGSSHEGCARDQGLEAKVIASEIVDGLVDIVCGVRDVMDITDEAFKRLARHSVESVGFARDIHRHLCRKLALPRTQENAVMLLVWFAQVGAMSLNAPLRKGRLFNAELNQKLAALHLLKELLACAGSSGAPFFQTHVWAVQIRRFAFKAVLHNAADLRRIELALPILSEMWKTSRRHLKIELAIAFEKIVLFVLNDRLSPPALRRELLDNVVSWFGMHPGDLVEMFLNFENDSLVPTWRTFEGIIQSLCHLADPAAYLIETDTESAAINQEMQYDALASLVTLLRALTDMSGTLRLMASDDVFRQRSSRTQEGFGWDLTSVGFQSPQARVLEGSSELSSAPQPDKHASVRLRHFARRSRSLALEQAFQLARTKGVHKAIAHATAEGLLEPTPARIAAFLHLYYRELGEREVGAYLGRSGNELAFMNEVRLKFTRALPFAGRSFEQCLRLFLESGHFFLPGESQQVEVLLEAFATCFVDENRAEFSRDDTDMIMVLSYSTVMLNTDLHNPAVNKKKKMTEEQFLRQISYIENGSRITAEFGTRLYRSIANHEITMASPQTTPELVHQSRPGMHRGGSGGAATIVSGPNGGASTSAGALDDSFRVCDLGAEDACSAAAGPGTSMPGFAEDAGALRSRVSGEVLTRSRANGLFQAKLVESVAMAQVITAAHAGQWSCYHSKVTSESVKVMFEVAWSHFYSLVTKILETPRTFSLVAVSQALDILSHSISISLFLGMETERKAFATLLAKLHYLYTNNAQHEHELASSIGLVKGDHLKDKWYADVMSASCYSDNVIEVISEVHHLTANMKETIASRQNYEKLLAIQKRFDGSVAIMEPGREFLREGTLSKRCRNKFRKYHFFLFSDLLIYASQRALTGGKYHVHQMLPLHTMQVRDTGDERIFEVRHPRKSFVAQASCLSDKHDWMRDIQRAVDALYHKQLSADSTRGSPTAVPPPTAGAVASNVSALRTPREDDPLASFSASSTSSKQTGSDGENLDAIAPPAPPASRACAAVQHTHPAHLITTNDDADIDEEEDEEEEEDFIQDPEAFDCDEDDEEDEEDDDDDDDDVDRNAARDGNERFGGVVVETGPGAAEPPPGDRLRDDGLAIERVGVRPGGAAQPVDGSDDDDDVGEDSRCLNSRGTLGAAPLSQADPPADQQRMCLVRSGSSAEDSSGDDGPLGDLDPVNPVNPHRLQGRRGRQYGTLKTVVGQRGGAGSKVPLCAASGSESAEEWVSSLKDQVGAVDASVAELDIAELHQRFIVGLRFAKPILTSSHSKYQATDEQKLLIYGFFKQSTQGDCNDTNGPAESDSVAQSKFRVWEALRGTSKTDAKRKFLTVLGRVAPGWSDRSALTA